jgi:hypothetical protein
VGIGRGCGWEGAGNSNPTGYLSKKDVNDP